MRIYIFSFFLFCALFTSNAQTTTYYNAKNKKVKSLEKADYYIVLAEDSTKEFRNIERKFNKSGQILSEQRFFWKDNNGKQLDGLCRKWYDNGQLQMETNYYEGRRNGVEIRYKVDGTVLQNLEYSYGKIVAVGQKNIVILHEATQMPEFPGGETELLKFVSSNIKYPVRAAEEQVQGTVFVRFVVLTTGEVAGADVSSSSKNDELDAEGLRVVELLPNFIPGKQNGIPIAVYYTLPIRFNSNK